MLVDESTLVDKSRLAGESVLRPGRRGKGREGSRNKREKPGMKGKERNPGPVWAASLPSPLFTSLSFPSLLFSFLLFSSLPFPSLHFFSLLFPSVSFSSLLFPSLESLPFPSLPSPVRVSQASRLLWLPSQCLVVRQCSLTNESRGSPWSVSAWGGGPPGVRLSGTEHREHREHRERRREGKGRIFVPNFGHVEIREEESVAPERRI